MSVFLTGDLHGFKEMWRLRKFAHRFGNRLDRKKAPVNRDTAMGAALCALDALLDEMPHAHLLQDDEQSPSEARTLVESLVDNWNAMERDILATAKRHIAPNLAKVVQTLSDIPPVTVEVDHLAYDPTLNVEYAINSASFDGALPLEKALGEYNPTLHGTPDELYPEDVLDIDYDICDQLVREAIDLGMTDMWPYGFDCSIRDGYEPWREHMLAIAKGDADAER